MKNDALPPEKRLIEMLMTVGTLLCLLAIAAKVLFF